ncbi:MAG: hypothetical protein ACK5PB_15375 [Pirellula sp.]
MSNIVCVRNFLGSQGTWVGPELLSFRFSVEDLPTELRFWTDRKKAEILVGLSEGRCTAKVEMFFEYDHVTIQEGIFGEWGTSSRLVFEKTDDRSKRQVVIHRVHDAEVTMVYMTDVFS